MVLWEAGFVEHGAALDCNTISLNVSGGAEDSKVITSVTRINECSPISKAIFLFSENTTD